MNMLFVILTIIIVALALSLIVARIREQRKIRIIAGNLQASHQQFSETLDEIEGYISELGNPKSPSPASEASSLSATPAPPTTSTRRLEGRLIPAHCILHSERNAPSVRRRHYEEYGGYIRRSSAIPRGYGMRKSDDAYYAEDDLSLVS